MSDVRYDQSNPLHKTLAIFCLALMVEGHAAHGTRLTRYISNSPVTAVQQELLVKREDSNHPDLPILLKQLTDISEQQFHDVLRACLERTFPGQVGQASKRLLATVPSVRILHCAKITGRTGQSFSFAILKSGFIITRE